MTIHPLPAAAKVSMSVLLGLATLVALFVVSLGLLDGSGRLDYDNSVLALLVCGAAAAGVIVLTGFTRFAKSVTGEQRESFARAVTWASVLLPVEVFAESVLHRWLYKTGGDTIWVLRLPAQFAIGGLLGLAVAISKRKWAWAIWGVIATLWGALWVAMMFSE